VYYGYARRALTDTDKDFKEQTRVVKDLVQQYLYNRHFSVSGSDVNSRVVEEQIWGQAQVRPKLDELVGRMESGSTLIVSMSDKVAGSVRGFMDFVQKLNNQGITLIVAQPKVYVDIHADAPVDPIIFDPARTDQQPPMKVLEMLAAMESDLLSERQQTAKSLKTRKKGGRKSALTQEQIDKLKKMSSEGYNQLAIAKALSVSQSTVSRYYSDLISKKGRAKNPEYKQDPAERRAKRRIYEAQYRERMRAKREAASQQQEALVDNVEH